MKRKAIFIGALVVAILAMIAAYQHDTQTKSNTDIKYLNGYVPVFNSVGDITGSGLTPTFIRRDNAIGYYPDVLDIDAVNKLMSLISTAAPLYTTTYVHSYDDVVGASGDWGDVDYGLYGFNTIDGGYPGATSIPPGIWHFDIWAYAKLTGTTRGDCRLVYSVYSRSTIDGSTTGLFTFNGGNIIADDYDFMQKMDDSSLQSGFTVEPTDSIMIKIGGQTNGDTVDIKISPGVAYSQSPSQILIPRPTESLPGLLWFDTVGDIAVGTGLGEAAGLSVGSTDGYVLTINSGATLGIGWDQQDHGGLVGLGDDDHSIYHTDARGDARYRKLIVYETDFLGVTAGGISPFSSAAIASGTMVVAAGNVDHPGVISLRSTTGNNSGYYIATTSVAFIVGGSEKITFIFKATNGASGNSRWRAGWQDGVAVSDPSNGIWLYFDQGAGTIAGKAQNGGGGVQTTATAYTYADATWYRGEIVINAAKDTITYTIYSAAGASLWTSTLTTFPAATVFSGVVAWNTAPVAARIIVDCDYLNYTIERTLTR